MQWSVFSLRKTEGAWGCNSEVQSCIRPWDWSPVLQKPKQTKNPRWVPSSKLFRAASGHASKMRRTRTEGVEWLSWSPAGLTRLIIFCFNKTPPDNTLTSRVEPGWAQLLPCGICGLGLLLAKDNDNMPLGALYSSVGGSRSRLPQETKGKMSLNPSILAG